MHILGRKLTTGSRLLLPCARGEIAGLAVHFTGVPTPAQSCGSAGNDGRGMTRKNAEI